MSESHDKFSIWNECTHYLSEFLAVYGVENNILSQDVDNYFLAFFSRDFLKLKQWCVFPLWEGDIRAIKIEDHSLNLAKILTDEFFKIGVNRFFRTTVELAKAPYEFEQRKNKDYALNIATSYINEIDRIFEVYDDCVPYWGHNFLWPSDRSIIFYTNGDNASFIVGDAVFIENILGVSLSYCLERFEEANKNHPGWKELTVPFLEFCKESR